MSEAIQRKLLMLKMRTDGMRIVEIAKHFNISAGRAAQIIKEAKNWNEKRARPLGTLSVRAQNALDQMGIKSKDQLDYSLYDKLRRWPNVGRLTLEEIADFAGWPKNRPEKAPARFSSQDQPPANGWRPIETAPADQQIIVGKWDDDVWIARVAIRMTALEDGAVDWVYARRLGPDGLAFILREPTHWQPLPAPPEVTHE